MCHIQHECLYLVSGRLCVENGVTCWMQKRCERNVSVMFIIFQGEFVGLLSMITKFLDKTGLDAVARAKLDKILKFISGKASGKPLSYHLLTVPAMSHRHTTDIFG